MAGQKTGLFPDQVCGEGGGGKGRVERKPIFTHTRTGDRWTRASLAVAETDTQTNKTHSRFPPWPTFQLQVNTYTTLLVPVLIQRDNFALMRLTLSNSYPVLPTTPLLQPNYSKPTHDITPHPSHTFTGASAISEGQPCVDATPSSRGCKSAERVWLYGRLLYLCRWGGESLEAEGGGGRCMFVI